MHDLVRHPAHARALPVVDIVLGCAAELHAHRPFGARELPGIAEAQPLVGLLDLPAVDDLLLEDSELVANAVAERGNLQRGERFDEACRETAEAAAPQTGLLL